MIFLIVVALIAGTAGALTWFKKHQKLGKPGIITTAIPGSVMMKINLPARVLDFTSTNVPEPEVVLGYLPKDTSYAERLYTAPDGFYVQATIILMGADRTSIHRPEFCLPGQGFQINSKTVVNIPIDGRQHYQLPVMKWVISRSVQTADGQKQEIGGLYIFWFVADNEESTGIVPMQLRMMRDQLLTGVLQRWAYISYFAVCEPGHEDAAFERVKKLIAASVPEFQLPPGKKMVATAAAP
ncbi:MAG: exosortase-associated EpsI family protein [Limisphaerales bacterium]